MRIHTENAVSPVVGVMLMLVVVIIIAAVVSAYAGGIASTTDKSPTVTIRGTYSQTEGVKIEHLGGNAIATMDTMILIKPSKTFGNAEHMVWKVNKSSITDSTGKDSKAWVTGAGLSGTKSFVSGDTAYILPPYQTGAFLQPGASSTYRFDSSTNVGKTFWLELADDAGRVFAVTEVTIQP
ncbi:MAG: type IV pilin [Methanoregulaceae archaeon]